MPGGTGGYLHAAARMLTMVAATSDTEAVVGQIVENFGLRSRKAARSYLQVLNTLGFVDVLGSGVHLTGAGQDQLAGVQPAQFRLALLQRIAGCEEVLAVLRRRPQRMSGLLEQMQDAGFDWSTDSQVRYRLRWLEEVGEVERHGVARPLYRLRQPAPG
jgi:hypothetical protein